MARRVSKEQIIQRLSSQGSQEPRMALSLNQEKDMVQSLSSKEIMLLPCEQKVG